MSDKKNYWEDMEDYAKNIIEDEGLDEENWHEAISTIVDGSSWIIYNHNHETILNETNNEPNDDEVRELGTDGGWREMRQRAAFLAMEGDLWDTLQDVKDEYFTCEDCGETNEGEGLDHDSGNEVCVKCYVNLTIVYNVEIPEHAIVAKTAKAMFDDKVYSPLKDYLNENSPFKENETLLAAICELAE